MENSPEPILRAKNIRKHFYRTGAWRSSRAALRAVENVSLELFPGETLGLVGESGCGKTTTGRVIMGLEPATGGEVYLEDSPNLLTVSPRKWFPWRRKIQMVFQDPYSSLNPRMTVGSMIGEALAIHRICPRRERRERVARLLEQVGLGADAMDRYANEFSGGQRQRIGIARALAVQPSVIIADEPVSALDVSIQAQIINLLKDLQKQSGVAYIFISHDLAVIGHMSDRIAVMAGGEIVELARKQQIFDSPAHPYTRMLLSAAPVADALARDKKAALLREVNPVEFCGNEVPHLHEISEGHWVSCRRVFPVRDEAR